MMIGVNMLDRLKKWAEAKLKELDNNGLYSGLFTGNPQGPGFVMDDYTREQALASVGPGWAKLVGALWDFCKSQDPPITISQVKEKYGTLRFYIGGVPPGRWDSVYTIIHAVEHVSEHICETCGKPGKLRGPGWYFTACDEHSRGTAPAGEEQEE